MTQPVVTAEPNVEGRSTLHRVLVLAGDLRLGGAEKQLVALAGGLVDEDVRVDVCVYDRGHHYDGALCATGAELIDGPRRSDPASRVAHAIQLARRRRPDLVLSWRFYLNIYAALAGRAIGVPGIGAMREDIDDAFAGVGRLGPACLRLPTAVLANSRRAATGIQQRGGTARYLGNVIDLTAFDAAAAAPVDPPLDPRHRPRILAVGTLKPEKAYDVLLEATRILLDDGGARPLVSIAGHGELHNTLQLQATELGLQHDDVQFLGSRNDVPALLRSADIAVLSSRQEGTPNAILEAMAAARPIVTTDVGDAAVLIEHGRSGLVVPPEDPTALAVALRTLLDDPATGAVYAAAARRAVRAYDAVGLGARAIEVLAPFCTQHHAAIDTTGLPEGGRHVRNRRHS